MSERGRSAEDAAMRFLQARGLDLVERNYRCRFGEIDLIMSEADTLVFVEVRMRSSSAFGGAPESITAGKQARLIAAARHYMAARRDIPACRFDAVLLDGDTRIDWVKNAFGE
jgi:putative endonuclease